MKNTKFKKVLPGLLAAGLACNASALPIMANSNGTAKNADEDENLTTATGVQLSKTATLEEDGTYTINLEAYATGKVESTTITKTQGVPCDIVMVLDQSGSMAESFGDGTSTTKKKALINAVNTFVDNVYADATSIEGQVIDHKIALVGFAGNKSGTTITYQNTGILSGSIKTVDYSDAMKYNGNNAYVKNALVSVSENGQKNPALNTASRRIQASGATYSNYGLELANVILNNRTQTTYTKEDGTEAARKKIVLFFTDGAPGHNPGTTFGEDSINFANKAITESDKLKAGGATVYSIAVLNGADPAANYIFTVNDHWLLGKRYSTFEQASNAYLHFISSNYTKATDMETSNGKAKDRNGYYVTATDSESLKAIFEHISSDINQSTTTSATELDQTAVIKDVIGEGFVLPKDAAITVKTADYKGKNASVKWSEPKAFNAVIERKPGENGLDEVNVSGFNYKENYVTDGVDEKTPSGKKVMVEIKGVYATDEAVKNASVKTNGNESGIYSKDEKTQEYGLFAHFERPKTIITNKLYVLDYAVLKNLSASDWKASTVIAAAKDMTSSKNNAAATEYGKLTAAENGLNYRPTTMQWNGFDTFYAFGTTNDEEILKNSANSNGYLWSKVSVLPANNVYYEDDFVTSEDNGTVGIVYTNGGYKAGYDENNSATSGNWEVVTDDEAHQDVNGQEGNSNNHGWIDDLATNNGFTGGSATAVTVGDGNGIAKAQFTVTGTGFDVYSRTNISTGNVTVQVKNAEGTVAYSKSMTINNRAESADYFHIPTVHFEFDEYGTYNVTLQVNRSGAKEYDENGNLVNAKQSTYYIDGIRVYNPIKNLEGNQTVIDAYGNEINANFISLRQHLIGAEASASLAADENGVDPTTASAFYIDKHDGSTSDLAVYKELGPKNEIYVEKGKKVVLKVEEVAGAKYQVGLKTPTGTANVKLSNGTENTTALAVNSATDMFYEVKSNNGYITIENTDDENDTILSITKLKITNAGQVSTKIMPASLPEVTAAAVTFDALPTVTYNTDNSISGDDEVVTNPDTDVVIDEGSNGNENDGSGNNNGSNDKKNFFETLFGGLSAFSAPKEK